MGKYDHIIELTGADIYPSWRRAVELALAGDGLWSHCSMGTDPNDIAEYTSSMPKVATAGQLTSAELTAIKEWVKEDAQAKAIIGRRLSPIIQNMLGEKLMARQQWDALLKCFGRLDVTSQFELRDQLFLERLKDAEDASRYISVFENGRRRFTEMGIAFMDSEAVWMLLHGLLETPQWVVFHSLTLGHYKTMSSSTSSTQTTTPTVAFKDVATAFTEEANHQRGQLKLARPGSEYSNAVAPPSYDQKVNSSNGVRIHKHNPKGVPCNNAACSRLPCLMTHDREHCLQPGGGMEGKALWNQQWGNKKKDVAAITTETKLAITAPPTTMTTPLTSSETTALIVSTPSQHRQDWSCAIVEELNPSCRPSIDDITCIISQRLSTILDSGTTSTLITSRKYFWTYDAGMRVSMKTANHGTLFTSGRGDCVADLTVGNRTQRLRLGDCLHAPG
ncbi:hypothetical protein BDR06DRAFT_862463, partial [Suillus hirtellus]